MPTMKYILFYLVAFVTTCTAVDLGHVENFNVEDFGIGFVKLAWDFVEGDATHPLHKYSLTVDSDLTVEFKCSNPTCNRIIEDLDACVEHLFELTPIFYTPAGDDTDGNLALTTGYTTDEIPGAVSDIRVTTDTDAETSFKWNQPLVNPKCVDLYSICYRLDGETDNPCVESNSTTVTVNNMSACATYHVTVTPLTPSGKAGPMIEYVFKTHDGVPGKPEDVHVGLITPETIQLLWNNPSDNFLCLERFRITIGETHAKIKRPAMRSASGYDNEFTFTPLFPCTDYTIDICSANEAEITSEKVIMYASTEEIEPLAPPSVTVTPSGPDTIEVSWGDNENDRCSGSFEVCWYDGVHPVEQCQEVGGDGDNNLVVHDLVPCSNYDFSITVHSPNGTFVSNSTYNSTSTADVRPGPVVNLHVVDVDRTEMTVKCEPPAVDPQCAKEVITRVIDENGKSQRVMRKSNFEETIYGLEPCTDYRILVSTKSPSGLQSEERETRNRTLDDIPSEPQAFNVTDVTTTSVTLQWFRPATNPRCATDYTLTWAGDVNDTITISDTSSFKIVYVVDGLNSCTNYNFTLNAESSAGQGPETILAQTTTC